MPARPPLWFIFSVTLSGILANTLLTPNIPDVLADLGRSDSMAGILVASGPLPGVFVAPVIGIAADRFGRRRVLLPCLVVFGLGGIAAAAAPSFWALVGARVLQGFGSAGLINLAVVTIGDYWAGRDRTKLIGWNSAALTLGLALVPAVAGAVAQYSSWRWALALSSVGLAVAGAGLFVMPDNHPRRNVSVSQQLREAAQVVRRPLNLSTIAAGFALFVVIFGVFLTAFTVQRAEEFGLGPRDRGLILSVSAIGSSVAALNLGRVRARFGLRPVLVGSSIMVAVAAVAVGTVTVLFMLIPALIAYGLADGLAIPSLQDVATSATPSAQRGAVLAAWVSAARLGQTLGPIGAAALFGATSTTVAMLSGAAIFGAVAIFLAVGPIDDAAVAAAAE